jgi:hypothetical protein
MEIVEHPAEVLVLEYRLWLPGFVKCYYEATQFCLVAQSLFLVNSLVRVPSVEKLQGL